MRTERERERERKRERGPIEKRVMKSRKSQEATIRVLSQLRVLPPPPQLWTLHQVAQLHQPSAASATG